MLRRVQIFLLTCLLTSELYMCAEYHVATVAFAMLGKGLISVTFCCVYVFTNEIFPTEVRNVGVGAAVMFGGVSNMAAAFFGGPLVSFPRFSHPQWRRKRYGRLGGRHTSVKFGTAASYQSDEIWAVDSQENH